jgi:hypothetical protein
MTYDSRIDQLAVLAAVGAVGNAICAAFGLVLVARGARNASNVILSITTGLITIALALLAFRFLETFPQVALSEEAGAAFFVASFTSLLESVVVLARRPRSRPGSDA